MSIFSSLTLFHPLIFPIKIQSLLSKPSNLILYRPRLSSFKPVYSSNLPLQAVESLPPKLQEMVKLFQEVEQPKAKYEQLLFYGRNLKPLGDGYKTSENKVEGCVSQVWVRAYLDDDKNVVFEADSDSMLTKGLAALLVQGLSGRTVEEIVRVTPDFVTLLGLQQSLTPSRNNGFLNMLKLMQNKALQLYVQAQRVNVSGNDGIEGLDLEVSGNDGMEGLDLEVKRVNVSGNDGMERLDLEVKNDSGISGESAGESPRRSGRGMRIKERLELELKPVELIVEDISYQHAGHSGVRGTDEETHFNVKVVANEFEGKSWVKRHRLIYELLQDELQSGLHALSIVAKTPSELSSES